MRIEDKHLSHYREHGYVIIENFLTDNELRGAQNDIEELIPGWLAYAADPTRPKPEGWNVPRGRPVRFPLPGTTLNSLAFHPELIDFATQIIGHDDLFCELADISYKCKGHPMDMEQPMHVDFINHTLAYPPNLPEYWQVSFIIYHTDVNEFSAPTAVCSNQHYTEEILWPYMISREEMPELYDNEIKVTVPAGSLLAYNVRAWHRGTAFKQDGARVVQFISYCPAAWRWLGIVGWSNEAIKPEFASWIAKASLKERAMFGFPSPGHPYWTEETLAGVSARYPEMDMGPYRSS